MDCWGWTTQSVGIWGYDSTSLIPEFINDAIKVEAIATPLAVYRCPSDIAEERMLEGVRIGSDNFTPVTPRPAVSSYAFCMGTRGPSHGIGDSVKQRNNGLGMYGRTFEIKSVTDGTSSTMLIGEVSRGDGGDYRQWNTWSFAARHLSSMRSTENPLNIPVEIVFHSNIGTNGAFRSEHPGGGLFGFADGHVKFLRESINLPIYRALSTRNGEEVVDDDF